MKMKKSLHDALIEGSLETSRVFLIGVVTTVLPYSTGLINTVTGEIGVQPRVLMALLLVSALTALGKGIDKAMHIYGKLTDDDVLKTGLTRF